MEIPELIRLPNGKYVDHRDVRRVIWHKAADNAGKACAAVCCADGVQVTVHCESDDAAKDLAETLGEEINQLRRSA
jgi:hypothetical protein